MRITTSLIFLLLITLSVNAQQLSLSVSPSQQMGYSIYSIADQQVEITSSYLEFKGEGTYLSGVMSYDRVEADNLIAAVYGVPEAKAQLFSPTGSPLVTYQGISVSDDDATVKWHALFGGRGILLDNVANFSIYYATGELESVISNSSGSSKGEAASMLVADEMGKTVVMVNPKIFYEGRTGSRARLYQGGGFARDIFGSGDRYISKARVSDDGQFVGFVLIKPNSDAITAIVDRYGNEICEIETDQEPVDIRFSAGNSHLTVNTGGRMIAYSLPNGKRIGSSSVRGEPLMIASYFPEDNMLVGVSGRVDNMGTVQKISVRAVDLKRRKLVSEETSAVLFSAETLPISLTRKGSSTYLLEGLSRDLSIKPRF